MIQVAKKRFFRRYEITIKSNPNVSLILNLLPTEDKSFSLYQILKEKSEIKNIDIVYNNTKIKLLELRNKDNKFLILFFHRCLLDDSMPMLTTDERIPPKSIEKKPEEKITTSGHIIIANNNKDNKYVAILEEIEGLPMSQLCNLINEELKNYDFQISDQNGKEIKITYSIEATGYLSKNLETSLKEGTINQISLVKLAQLPSGLVDGDLNEYFEPKEEILTVKIKKRRMDAKTLLKKAKEFFEGYKSKGYERLKFKLTGSNKRSTTIALTREEEAKEKLFVFSDEVDFDSALPSCTESINETIINKVIPLLEEE